MKKVTKQTYINWYKDMLFWRKFEDKLASVYIQQKVRGFLHSIQRPRSRSSGCYYMPWIYPKIK